MKQATNNQPASPSSPSHEGLELNQLAALYKACGDALRLEILRVLKNDSFGVLELSHVFDMKQSAMSHHLKVLSTHNLVQTRREGNSIFYQRRINLPDSSLLPLFKQIDGIKPSIQTEHNIRILREQRANLGKAFFSKNVSKFKQQQELIAPSEQYLQHCLNLLVAYQEKQDSILELGPGEGSFLKDLSKIFKQVIALDYSKEMLTKSKELCLANGLSNVNFILGECSDAIQQKITVDNIVMNMVLHHLPSPASSFKQFEQLLNPNGTLVICELCQHEHEWAKEACGDLWLGFDEEALKNWAQQAGLQFQQSSYLALRNGFQLIFCSFKKPHSSQAIQQPT